MRSFRSVHGCRVGVGIFALASALLLGCGGDDSQERAAGSPGAAQDVVAIQPASDLALPAPGEVELSVSGGRVTLLANEASLGLVLSRLAFELGFEVAGLEAPLDATPVTLHIVDAALEEVLRLSLSGREFVLEYGLKDGQSAIVRLALGEGGPAASEAAVAPGTSGRRAVRAELRKRQVERRRAKQAQLEAMPKEEREQLEAEKRRAREEQEARVAADLAAADTDRRASAVAYLDDRERVGELVSFLESDPSPRVRAEAAKTLGDVDTVSSTRALVKALSDRDPNVVKEALDALQWRDDPSVVDDVRSVLKHRNAEVRELAAETIDWLQK